MNSGRVVVGAVVQARMSSTRLPGKVLRRVGDRPLIGHLLDRLGRCGGLDRIIVATSTETSDDPLADYCQANGVECFRGDLADVARRFVEASRAFGLDAFLRVCADSPLLDHRLADRAVALYRAEKPDLVTNVLRRTFPRGQSVEVVDAALFQEVYDRLTEDRHREHVTAYFYEHPSEFDIVSFESGGDHGRIQLSVDTAKDLARIEWLIGAAAGAGLTGTFEDLVGLLAERGES